MQVSSLSIHCVAYLTFWIMPTFPTRTRIYICVCVFMYVKCYLMSRVSRAHMFSMMAKACISKMVIDIIAHGLKQTSISLCTHARRRSASLAPSFGRRLTHHPWNLPSPSLSLSSFYCHFLCGQHAGRILSGTRFSFHLFVCPLYVCALLITGDSFGSFASFCCRLPIEMSKQRSPLTNDHNQHNI